MQHAVHDDHRDAAVAHRVVDARRPAVAARRHTGVQQLGKVLQVAPVRRQRERLLLLAAQLREDVEKLERSLHAKPAP